MFIRRCFGLLTIALCALALTVPAFAAERVVRYTERYNETQTFPLGPEGACFKGAEMITLKESGLLRITEVVSGPNAGTFHLRGRIEGTFRAFTDATTFITGTFSQNVNFKMHRGDTQNNSVVHATGTTPGGERVKLQFHVHFTMRDGEITREVFKINCIK